MKGPFARCLLLRRYDLDDAGDLYDTGGTCGAAARLVRLCYVRHPERLARDKAGPATWADIPRCLTLRADMIASTEAGPSGEMWFRRVPKQPKCPRWNSLCSFERTFLSGSLRMSSSTAAQDSLRYERRPLRYQRASLRWRRASMRTGGRRHHVSHPVWFR